MDFFLNWCINCGKRSEYLYCSKECRLNDLKKNKAAKCTSTNYTLEFKNRKPIHNHSYYKTKNLPISPLLKINIPQQSNIPNRNCSFSSTSSSSTCSSNSDMSICSSPSKDSKLSQKPRYYIQTFNNNKQYKPQLLTPISEKDNMEYENSSIFSNSHMYSEEEVNENSSFWYWSSSDDEEDDE